MVKMEEKMLETLPLSTGRFSTKVNQKVKQLYEQNKHNFCDWEDDLLLQEVINPILKRLEESSNGCFLHAKSFVEATHNMWRDVYLHSPV